MRRFIPVIWLSLLGSAANAVPVVPNFQQGSMTSHTETNSTVQETIYSIDYNTGWEYSVTGVGIENGQNPVNPNVTNSTVYVSPGMTAANGSGMVTSSLTSSFDSLDLSSQPNFTLKDPGGAFQFTQSYQGPGMTNQTIIQRTTTIQSVTDTTSTFTQ